ncbi:MAG: BTAD domain-containing putative transcriptional regulator [Pseudomonadota bacterium]
MPLRLFGGFHFTDNAGEPVNLPTRHTGLVLAGLALSGRNGVSRNMLASWIWPDRGVAQARSSLRQALAAIRKALPDCFQQGSVAGTAEHLQLICDTPDVDIFAFEQAAESHDLAKQLHALMLYCGPLLDGINLTEPLEQLVLPQREHFRSMALQLLDTLSQDAEIAREQAQTLEAVAAIILQSDPAAESAHRGLIRIRLSQGQTVEAQRQMEICRNAVNEIYGTDPAVETVSLLERTTNHARGQKRDSSLVNNAEKSSNLFSNPALLVMEFENLSGDPNKRYFARGIADDIAMALAYWRWFPVISPNAVSAVSGKPLDIRDAADQVDAQYVLTGSVRQSGSQARIIVQLTEASTGHTLWSERFDREMDDVFSVQDEISENVVARVEPFLQAAEFERLGYKRADKFTAWDYLLQATQADLDGGPGYGTQEANLKVRALLQKVFDAGSPPAAAYAMLARSHWKDAIMGWSGDREYSLRQALDVSGEGIRTDPNDWTCRGIHGLAYLFGYHKADVAIEHAREAVRLNPSAPLARHCFGCALEFNGYPEQALEHLNSVFRLDPNFAGKAAVTADITMCHLVLKQFREAAQWAARCRALAPEYVRGLHRVVAALAFADRLNEASDALSDLLRLQPDLSVDYIEHTYPFVDPSYRHVLIEGLRRAGWNA